MLTTQEQTLQVPAVHKLDATTWENSPAQLHWPSGVLLGHSRSKQPFAAAPHPVFIIGNDTETYVYAVAMHAKHVVRLSDICRMSFVSAKHQLAGLDRASSFLTWRKFCVFWQNLYVSPRLRGPKSA